jgi:hypothetical protein
MRRDGGFSGELEGWSPQADVSAFAMLLFEIMVGHSCPSSSFSSSSLPPPRAAKADREVILPPGTPGIPEFVSEIIEDGVGLSVWRGVSFIRIFETLKANGFRIVAGVDSDEVSPFISCVESIAQSGKSE